MWAGEGVTWHLAHKWGPMHGCRDVRMQGHGKKQKPAVSEG